MTDTLVDTSVCRICKADKPLSEFYRHKRTKNGFRGECKPCSSAETIGSVRLRLYGVSPERYDRMTQAQNGLCAICRKTCSSGRNLSVDHCHSTGKVRGLLCGNCNHGIGKFADDPNLLTRAASYVKGEILWP